MFLLISSIVVVFYRSRCFHLHLVFIPTRFYIFFQETILKRARLLALAKSKYYLYFLIFFRICQWNVQRLTDSKLEEIRSLLTRPGNEHDRLDILILSETFCTQKVPDSFYNTDGYQLHRKDRMGKSGGGVLVYVNNSLQAKRREDLEAEDLEILWLEACPYKSSRSLFIGDVYRPPSLR